jgi:DNA repair ATPase RecN
MKSLKKVLYGLLIVSSSFGALGKTEKFLFENFKNFIAFIIINYLIKKDRIQVLAKMLGGDKTGKAALNNALELLN